MFIFNNQFKTKTLTNSIQVQEERLFKQQKEYENEIRQLNETIQRLEDHLAEQSKTVAEERWKSKQQEKKLEALQDALVNEQRIVMEKLARERNDIDRSKDDILLEQKRQMQQVYEEKRKLSEEKAQLDANIAAYKEKQHRDSLNSINIEADNSVATRRINEEKARLEKLAKDLEEQKVIINKERDTLQQSKNELEVKMGKLEQMAFSVNQKYSNAEDLYNVNLV
jgi:chromosome segregation ATPase